MTARGDSVIAQFALNSSAQGVAIQFDVDPLEAGVSLTDPTLENAAPHLVDSNLLGSGTTRFLVYSASNAPLNPDGLVTVSLGVTSPALLTDAMLRIENIIVSDSSGQVVDGQPNAKPVILSRFPDQYRSIQLGCSLPLSVQAIDPDDAVTSVSFRLNGISQGTDDARPFAFDWTPSSAGLYSFDTETSGGSSSRSTSAPVELRAYAQSEITSFAGFAGIHFGPDANDPAVAGPSANPFGNGQNLLTYFLGLNPWTPDWSNLPQLIRDQSGNLIFHFRRSATATGVSYTILNTPGLQPDTWQQLTGLPVTTTDLANGLQEVSVIVPSTGERGFYKLKVTQTTP